MRSCDHSLCIRVYICINNKKPDGNGKESKRDYQASLFNLLMIVLPLGTAPATHNVRPNTTRARVCDCVCVRPCVRA